MTTVTSGSLSVEFFVYIHDIFIWCSAEK